MLCCDYYHVMGCPEWEELELSRGYGSDFDPAFSRADMRGYSRPDWFFQGPLSFCAARSRTVMGDLAFPFCCRETCSNAMDRAQTWWEAAEVDRRDRYRSGGLSFVVGRPIKT